MSDGAPVMAGVSLRDLLRRAAVHASESANYRAALERTLAACLPELGDFGFFDARASGDEVVRAALAYRDEALEALLRPTRWVRQERNDMNLCALSTGQAALHADIDDEWYRRVAASDGHLEILRRLAFRSMITVPLRDRGELLGALTLFMGSSGRRHTAEHLETATDIAAIVAPVVAGTRMRERHEEAQARLELSNERLRLSVRAAGLGAWEWRFADDSVHWSPEYREIYGFSADEPPTFERGMSVVHPEDRPLIEQALRDAIATRGEFACAHRVMHAGRGLRWLRSIGRPVLDELGEPVALTGMVMDVTEAQRAHEDVHTLRDQLAGELEAMRRLHQVSGRTIGRDDRLEDLLAEILDAALEITGRDRGAIQLLDEAAGCLRFAAQRGFDADFVGHFREVRREDPTPSAMAWRRGSRIVIEDIAAEPLMAGSASRERLLAAGVRAVQSTPLFTRDGRLIGMFTTHSGFPHGREERELRLLDLLSREAADFIERAQAAASLKEADRRKDEFLAILAHELRNPLAPIRYATSIARAPGSTEEQRREAQSVIERQVAHMGRLLDDLLDVSRIARGSVELRPEVVQVDGVIAAAIELARPLMQAKDHRLETSIAEPGLAITADPVRLAQIVGNLLTNAAKYTDPGGLVTIAARRDGEALVLEVTDTGIGMTAEMHGRLFSLFSQADDAVQRAEGGLGIGLALVKGFVALHRGTVEAHSEGPNRGSRFTVRLPGLLAAATPSPASAEPEPASRPLRVLVADDNPDICQTCTTLVEIWGHEARAAADGSEALQRVREFRPDVALLDLGMPEMNGLEVARAIRGLPQGDAILLIAVTGWGQGDVRSASTEAGFDHHLTKPVDVASLHSLLAKAAARR